MKSAQSILSTIYANTDTLRSYGVTKIGLFGSAARGESTPSSDIDVVLDFETGKKTYRNFIGTATFLEQILNRPVDVITSTGVSPYLKPYIKKDIQYVQIKH